MQTVYQMLFCAKLSHSSEEEKHIYCLSSYWNRPTSAPLSASLSPSWVSLKGKVRYRPLAIEACMNCLSPPCAILALKISAFNSVYFFSHVLVVWGNDACVEENCWIYFFLPWFWFWISGDVCCRGFIPFTSQVWECNHATISMTDVKLTFQFT